MTVKPKSQGPALANTELLILAHWEEFLGWFLSSTGRWPKNLRFTLTQRIENHALDILEELVQARYQKHHRVSRLQAINLRLERMRFLLRIAKQRCAFSNKTFESSMRRLNESGKMLHGWRQSLAKKASGQS